MDAIEIAEVTKAYTDFLKADRKLAETVTFLPITTEREEIAKVMLDAALAWEDRGQTSLEIWKVKVDSTLRFLGW